MTSLNDYFLAGRKALERWRPDLQTRFGRDQVVRSAPRASAPLFDPGVAGGDSLAELGPNGDQPWPPTLDALLAQVGDLPPYSLTLGACEDGLPFLLDLNYPAPGALLVCGDAGSGKTRLLRSLADSAVAQNEPEQVQISVLALDPDAYLSLATAEHCQEIFPIDDPAAVDLIKDLSEIVEARRHGRPDDPAILLLIDGLAEGLHCLDQDAFERLYRLARHGPRSRVWTIASLDARQLQAVDSRFLAAFRTRLLGRMRNRHSAESLAAPADPVETRDLENGQFLMPYGGEWLRLWACEPACEPEISAAEDEQ